MKKAFYCLMVLMILTAVVSCGTKPPNTTANNTANTSSNSSNAKTYTKEFSYLPAYNGIKSAVSYKPASTAQPLGKATYIIQNAKDTQVFENYEALLKKDGWTITHEEKVINFSAKKQDHIANISISIYGTGVMLTIESK
ncbi:hypothetical protein DEAC_c37270 [Desulfosporosinus acididurans]|uniref:Lipoprotein n=1 Tax=Desulfosporosinus acididurans TaxID=476652 RepID=A0A0J1FLQ1_9FIRM|nr:hypothetical protein [Desulfosporosinus acididurans]KLU64297.1 hypothetical protein DEAC_c37270 [Desulfosporosinus acididurans]